MKLGIGKIYKDEFKLAIVYYGIISAYGDLNLTPKELQVLAYVAIRGTITGTKKKREFIRLFGGTIPSIGNMICNLKQKGLLIRKGPYVMINPAVAMKPEDIEININLKLENNGSESTGE